MSDARKTLVKMLQRAVQRDASDLILKTGKDREDFPAPPAPESCHVRHQNIRGSEYYTAQDSNTERQLPGMDGGSEKGGSSE